MSFLARPSSDEVVVWRIPLDPSPQKVEALASVLSPDELGRAAAQATGRLRRRFVVAHGATRRILGSCVDADPGTLRFAAGPHGKPRLIGSANAPRFNLAHSGELALLAVALDREVGVDVEWIDPRRDIEAITRAFTAEERAALARLPGGARRAAAFQAWARKEACLKATGRGFTGGFESVEVSVDPSVGPRIVSLHGGADEAARWTLVDLDCGADYLGALAACGAGWRVRMLDAATD